MILFYLFYIYIYIYIYIYLIKILLVCENLKYLKVINLNHYK